MAREVRVGGDGALRVGEARPGAQAAVKLWLWAAVLVGPLEWDGLIISEKDLGPKSQMLLGVEQVVVG